MTRSQVSTFKKMLPHLYLLLTLNILACLAAIIWLILVLQRQLIDVKSYALIIGGIGIIALPLVIYCFVKLIISFKNSLDEDHQADRKKKRKKTR